MGVVANNNYYYPWAFINNPEIPGRIPFGVLLHRVSKNNRKCRSSWNAGTEGKPKGPFVYFPLRGVYMNQQPHNHFKPLFKRQILQPYSHTSCINLSEVELGDKNLHLNKFPRLLLVHSWLRIIHLSQIFTTLIAH